MHSGDAAVTAVDVDSPAAQIDSARKTLRTEAFSVLMRSGQTHVLIPAVYDRKKTVSNTVNSGCSVLQNFVKGAVHSDCSVQKNSVRGAADSAQDAADSVQG